MMIFSLLLASTLLISGSSYRTSTIHLAKTKLQISSTDHMTTLDSNDLAEKLVNGFYGDFFNYLVRDDIIESIWNAPNSLQKLEHLIKDVNAPMKARFLACEVLFEKHFIFVPDVGSETVAEIYAQALLNNYTEMANSWGFLYEHNDEGPVGIRFVMIGIEAVPVLVKLLDNNDQSMLYNGSQEAMLGNSYQFRIKDYAAFYISKIKRIPVQYHQDPQERDAEIEKLKFALAHDQ
ncbi:hypothetical protein Cylst_1924 [Cylindrospermum stagnale PCC 7417]|uniref:Uncharacterized protein n=2 Tax=Cylindrospermum stagnale TaxID=142864 RepID=K9WVE7_9NOST|nr:hypothetical protein Cylst_1924 [Cylindrospermum stagnale PCC 7417]